MNDKDWKKQDDYRDSDCCGHCKYGRQWNRAISTTECLLHGSEVDYDKLCNSFERDTEHEPETI